MAAFICGLVGVGGLPSTDRAGTLAFMTLAFGQIFHLGNARDTGPVLAPWDAMRNPYALAAVALSVGLQILGVVLPSLAAVLHMTPMGIGDWILVAGLGVAPGIIGQILKRLSRKVPPSFTSRIVTSPP